ncbi:MAG: hypothetical protein ACI9JO_001636 [Psychrobacter okhotskensis]|jgi:hypothetical protein
MADKKTKRNSGYFAIILLNNFNSSDGWIDCKIKRL